MPEGFLLSAAAHLVEAVVGQPHHMGTEPATWRAWGNTWLKAARYGLERPRHRPNGSVPTSLSVVPAATRAAEEGFAVGPEHPNNLVKRLSTRPS